MARRKRREEHPNHERWLVSYADFITLLFAFFVTLYAISQVDAKKMTKLVVSMQKAFDTRVLPAGSDRLSLSDGGTQGSDPATTPPADPAFPAIQETIQQRLIKENFVDKVRFVQNGRGLVISLSEAGFFDSGAATMKASSLKVLDAIAASLLQISNQVRVEGHTDNTPIRTAQFPSNWELSTARATHLIAYLTSHFPFEPHRLSVAGYGEHRPVASNGTAEGRMLNRRVDIVILSDSQAKQEPR